MDGNIATAYWQNPDSQEQQFITTWSVPPAPMLSNTQIIYLYSSRKTELGNAYIRTVLQWNWNYSQKWQVSTWSYRSDPPAAQFTTPVEVLPGDVLHATINSSGVDHGQGYFNIPGTLLALLWRPEYGFMSTCILGLACMGGLNPIWYPPTFRTCMKGIRIRFGSLRKRVFIPWIPQKSPNALYGHHPVIVSQSSSAGEVDFCYGTVATASLSAAIGTVWGLDSIIGVFGVGTDGSNGIDSQSLMFTEK